MANLRIVLAFLAATTLLLAILQRQGVGLVNERSPYGIVSLELAGSAHEARAIVSAWEAEGKTATAIRNIRLDFLLIPFYSILLYMACGSLATNKPARHSRIGAWIAFGCLLAGLLDVFENIIMMSTLRGRISETGVTAASLLAKTKFAWIGLALAYILYSSIRSLSGRQGDTHRAA
jgi:hypothetical protein